MKSAFFDWKQKSVWLHAFKIQHLKRDNVAFALATGDYGIMLKDNVAQIENCHKGSKPTEQCPL